MIAYANHPSNQGCFKSYYIQFMQLFYSQAVKKNGRTKRSLPVVN
jgi:hypothetical protein